MLWIIGIFVAISVIVAIVGRAGDNHNENHPVSSKYIQEKYSVSKNAVEDFENKLKIGDTTAWDKVKNAKNKSKVYIYKTEYEAWLDFLEVGGTSDEFEKLKTQHNLIFKHDPLDNFRTHQAKYQPVFKEYMHFCKKIEFEWKNLRDNADFVCNPISQQFEDDCNVCISLFKQLQKIDQQYGESGLTGTNCFKRLAMLYEKQRRYPEAVEVCKDAIKCGVDEGKRLERMTKKMMASSK